MDNEAQKPQQEIAPNNLPNSAGVNAERPNQSAIKDRDQLLQQSQALFQNVIYKSADGILIIDRQGIIQFVNPAAEKLFGRPAEGLLGASFGFPVTAGETTELDIFRQNDGVGVAEMRVVEITWEDSVAFLATLRDVTQRKRQEREIQQRNVDLSHRVEKHTAQIVTLNERINAIFETASEVIVLVAADGRIDMINPAVDQKFGYEPDEILHQPLIALIEPTKRPSLEDRLVQLAQDGRPQRTQVLGLHKNGSTFDVEISLARVRDNENQIVCIFHDITHFKSIERMKDEFISMVSHELRSPITSMALISDGLQHFYERYTESQIKQKLAELNNQSHVLIKLIGGILDISRLEAQTGQIIEPEPVNIAGTLTNIMSELQADAQEKNQTLLILSAGEAVVVNGNPLDLDRIWRNLINNAIKYTSENGWITARLECLTAKNLPFSNFLDKGMLSEHLADGRRYAVGQVIDNGHGIAPADMPKMFQRFHRGWAQSSDIPGTGLGLALVKQLLSLYKGDIHVSSELGKGTTFTFWIPM